MNLLKKAEKIEVLKQYPFLLHYFFVFLMRNISERYI